MKDRVFLVSWCGIVVLGSLQMSCKSGINATEYVPVHIGLENYLLEYVDTPGAMERGLKGRSSLAAGHGMLFDFKKEQKFGVTMNGCSLSLCVCTVSKDWRILEAVNMYPGSANHFFKYPARFMIEIPETKKIAPGIKIYPTIPQKDQENGRLFGPITPIKRKAFSRANKCGEKRQIGLYRFRGK